MKTENLITEFNVKTAGLNKVLTKLSKIVGKKGCGLSLLEYIHIQNNASSGILILTASNQELSVRSKIPVKIVHGKEFKDMLLPVHNVLPILKNIKDKEITIKYYSEGVKNNNKIIIQAGKNEHEFRTEDPIEYLDTTKLFTSDITLCDISSEDFIKNIKPALPYCTKDNFKPAMMGVKLELSKETNMIKFTATDSYTLFHSSSAGALNDANFIIEAKSLRKILYFINPKICDYVTFFAKFKEKEKADIIEKIIIQYADYEFSVKTIDEKFPPYQSIISEEEGIEITVDYKELLDAANTAKLTAEVYNYTGKFQIDNANAINNVMKIITEDTNIGNKSNYEIDCKCTLIDNVEFALNLKKLINILNSYKDYKPDTVVIHYYSIGEPVKLIINDNMLSIQMPIRLS